MAAGVERAAEANKGALQGILEALHGCVGKLQQSEDAVRFTINWDKIQCLPDVGPAFLYSVLQQHISDLQPLLAHLQSLATGKEEKNISSEDAVTNLPTADVEETKKADSEVASKCIPEKGVPNTSCLTDPAVVQIQAGKSEIDRRILAFIERKQAEINENNVREFCNVIDCNQGKCSYSHSISQ
ncbi:MAP3K12-binding inhibitory protein 1 [Pyxicephalus adspersus]|uniref:Uncharacterized protein n=1 Tax=Pyxicephalus adspersus TaxID=30357 RepID=A0AAV2ZL16_PYXAD|nr:TPA: hypothetical protein GDO54_005262 [Pyxicephalus adspersus]